MYLVCNTHTVPGVTMRKEALASKEPYIIIIIIIYSICIALFITENNLNANKNQNKPTTNRN